jgi:ribosomal protein L32
VKKKKKVKEKKYLLHLTCQNCGHKFTAERFRKYCVYECQREVNNQLAKNRYAEMREVFLKSKGVIE